MRVAAAVLALLGVLIEPVLGHDVDPDILPRDMLGAARADPVHQPEIGAVLGDPLRPVRPLLDIGHPLLHPARGILDKQLRRHARHVEMAIGGDALVMHGAVPSGWLSALVALYRLLQGFCQCRDCSPRPRELWCRRQAPAPAPMPLPCLEQRRLCACISRENTGWRVSPVAAFLGSRSTLLLQMQGICSKPAEPTA